MRKIFRVTVCEDEIYSNVDIIAGTDEHLGTFSSLAKAESIIDKHYCKRFPGQQVYDRDLLSKKIYKLVIKGAALPGVILRTGRKIKNGYIYSSGGLISYKINVEEIK